MPTSGMRPVGVGAGPAHGMAHGRCRRTRRAVIREKLLFSIVNRALAAQGPQTNERCYMTSGARKSPRLKKEMEKDQ